MSPPGWPVHLEHATVAVRPLKARDASAWSDIRIRNEQWLAPWEGRAPSRPAASWAARHSQAAFGALIRQHRRETKAGRQLALAVTVQARLAGAITVGAVTRGAFDSAYVGYWLDRRHAGAGVMPTALALVLDHAFGPLGLHRVEANIRPENLASLRVVRKLGFVEEGLHRRYLFIDEDWRDHLTYALLAEDVPAGGVLQSYLAVAGR